MSEMVERVAKAIQIKCKERGYPECPAPLVHHIAAAAIEAMQEPTEPMIDAAMATADGSGLTTWTMVWRAMTDAALATEPVE